MISLEEFIKQEDRKSLLKLYGITDINEWLLSSYEDVADKMSEDEFYESKYDSCFYDTPEYWLWQEQLYEMLNSSIKTMSPIMLKLLDNVDGVEKIIRKSDYVIGIYYNDKFDKDSDEFKTLLNFSNYFIQSKEEGGRLPNPFYLEARVPEELKNDYDCAYHITNKYAYEKIKKYGLKASDKTKFVNHDPRVYMWVNDNKLSSWDIMSYGRLSIRIWKMSMHNNEFYDEVSLNDIVILKIDLKKFREHHKKPLRIFGDPAYNKKSAVFTLESISTEYISKISEEELKKELA